MQQRTAIEGIEVGERDTLAKLQEILYSTVARLASFRKRGFADGRT